MVCVHLLLLAVQVLLLLLLLFRAHSERVQLRCLLLLLLLHFELISCLLVDLQCLQVHVRAQSLPVIHVVLTGLC